MRISDWSSDVCSSDLEIMSPLQDDSRFPDQRPHALAMTELGALFDADFGALGRAAEGAEHGRIGVKVDRIVAPVARRHPASVTIENPVHLQPVKRNLQRTSREGRSDKRRVGEE